MVGNLKKLTVFFKFSHRFFEEERGRKRKKVRVGEGKFLTFVFFFRRK